MSNNNTQVDLLGVEVKHKSGAIRNYTQYTGIVGGENIEYNVFETDDNRGPKFTWEWELRPNSQHTLEQANAVEHAIYNSLNTLEVKRGPHYHGEYRLTDGRGLTWLTGAFTILKNCPIPILNYYFDGSRAMTEEDDIYPIFTFDTLLELAAWGMCVIEDDCMIINNGDHYLISTNNGVTSIRVIGDMPDDIACYVVIEEAIEARSKYIAQRDEAMKHVATFDGFKGDVVEICECPMSLRWMVNGRAGLEENVRLITTGDKIYGYLSAVEIDATALAWLERVL